MKKLLALFSFFMLFLSCTSDTNETTIHYELLKIESVVMPTDFYVNEENQIIVKFIRPTNCHGFDGFYYQKSDFTRTVAVQGFVIEQNNCTNLADTDAIATQTLNFMPTTSGTYLFKFWKGKDANGTDIFEEISIVVP